MTSETTASGLSPTPATSMQFGSSTGAVVNSSTTVAESPLANNTQPDGMLKQIDPGALLRGSIVFGVLCLLVVLYIAFRTCRLRRNRKAARYNVLSTTDESAPLHSDDDEEETVFDASGPNR